jgi:thiopurine S-methyltransferase
MRSATVTVEEWQHRWHTRAIGWHLSDPVHYYLHKHFATVTAHQSRRPVRVLVPLCGATNDMYWLAAVHGCSVVGVEYTQQAIVKFFKTCNIAYEQYVCADRPVYCAAASTGLDIRIIQSDMYDVPALLLPMASVECIWDRASFVAIDVSDRQKYTDVLCTALRPNGCVLISVVDYDPTTYPGPPHNVSAATIQHHFGNIGSVTKLDDETTLDEQQVNKFKTDWRWTGMDLVEHAYAVRKNE